MQNLQKDIRDKILKAHVNFKKSPKERLASEQYIQIRLESLENLWDRFKNGHEEIIKGITDWAAFESSDYASKGVYESTEESYMDYKQDLLRYKPKLPPIPTGQGNSNGGSASIFKLPKITLPTFSGKYEEWVTFREMFVSLVHSNTSLDNVTRLHYLKGHLTGEAEQLIRQLPITAGNYAECWKQLQARYDNKNYLANCILKRLMNQRVITKESSVLLKELADTTYDCLHALKNIGIDIGSWDIIIIYIVSNKLDSETRKQWELKVAEENSDELPKFVQLREFLESRFRALEFIQPERGRLSAPHKFVTQRPKVMHATSIVCECCTGDHKLYSCTEFANKDVNKKRQFIMDKRLCFNCLGSNHSAKFCPSKSTCRVCRRKHHSIIHTSESGDGGSRNVGSSTLGAGVIESSTRASAATSGGNNAAPVVSCFGQVPVMRQVVLATAVVLAKAHDGQQHFIRALLDQGSQASFVTEATVQYLGIRKSPIKGIITGLEGKSNTVSKNMVELSIQSRLDKNIVIQVRAYVLKSITTFLPNCKVGELDWLDRDMCLADPQYHTPSKIDVLLGADIYGQILQTGIRKGPKGYPLAQATSLGWVLSGTYDALQAPERVVAMHTCVDDNEALKRFWELEAEPKPTKKFMSEEEVRCESFFAESTKRDSEGRYIVKLPFKADRPECVDGDSRSIAVKRLNGLQARFQKNEDLKDKYKRVMDEYLHLGFMEKVPEIQRNNSMAVYLPHHAVIRNDKDTTKVRVVYDASCKYKNGVSLNDTLMVGPTLQPDLRHLLMRWRQYPICLSADIVKMYCQVKVAKEDTNFQRLLWQDVKDTKAEDYRLLRVTFGTAAAPYLAVKCLQQTAHDEGASFPAASARVINDFYMDDLLTGCHTVKDGIVIYQEMNSLLQKGGFELQKWMSNSDKVLQAIKETNTSKDDGMNKELNFKTDEIVKLLGLTWNRRTDEFRYSVTLSPEPAPVTKRKIISHIARLYDPLGWAAPSVIVAKILIQKLWISGLGWDEEVTGKLLEEWNTYFEGLSVLTQINIPRWLGTDKNDSVVELHGFCDASKMAYAAAIYLRRIDADGVIHVTLITAKTKVAPIKQISIPRLELCGAVLVAKLLVEVAEVLKIEKSHIRAWTDSTVVLAWLNSHPSRWQTFVANRVSEILTTLESDQWSHVKTKQNPADIASRGITSLELLDNSMWFSGPEFLRQDNLQCSKPETIETQLEEIKVHVAVPEVKLWKRYSSLTKLVRIVAYCRRFLDLRKPASERRRQEYLTSVELAQSLETCVKQCQREHFKEEMELIKKNGKWSKLKGPLKSLNPYIDDKCLLRVGGRLDNTLLDEGFKHPILLPKKSTLTDLIIADAHTRTLHGGIQVMLTYLCTKFFVLGAKSSVKAFVRKCVICTRYNASTSTQLMGQLPAARTTPARAFKSSGVDYAGPISIRTSKGRGHHAHKGYICLYVCMVTRAVHIEAVTDLTAQSFLAAFKRFVARRGHCSDLWSDNGTNFVGASREIQSLLTAKKSSIRKEIAEALATNGTTWHFIPPHSPNFGGLWEAGIKSVKFHLKRIIGDTTLTYEELSTVLVQIEACLNSRPLARLDTESDAVEALTPGHFLVGEPLITAPDHDYEASNVRGLRRWQLTQKLMQNFWKRWSQEYLTKFLHRYKWAHQNPEPGIGDIVLVKEDNVPPCRWLLGRVVAKHAGSDNVTRVVTLRTKNSCEVKRPTSKLCILPLTD